MIRFKANSTTLFLATLLLALPQPPSRLQLITSSTTSTACCRRRHHHRCRRHQHRYCCRLGILSTPSFTDRLLSSVKLHVILILTISFDKLNDDGPMLLSDCLTTM